MSDSEPRGPAFRRRSLRVERKEDSRGADLFVVYDAGGIAESAPDVRGLSPSARMAWAEQQGLAADLVQRAGEADGLMFRGNHDGARRTAPPT
jgi:hypothetical protein